MPDLNGLQFEGYNKRTEGRLEARHGDETVGYLTWKPSKTGAGSHEVQNVWTNEGHRGQGVAKQLWSRAHEDYDITLGHSPERSALGDAFARSVGGPTPGVQDVTTPSGEAYQMRYRHEDLGERKPRHIVEAYQGGAKAGELNWNGSSGVVHHATVRPEHSGRGLGPALWEHAQGLAGVRKPKGTVGKTFGRGD